MSKQATAVCSKKMFVDSIHHFFFRKLFLIAGILCAFVSIYLLNPDWSVAHSLLLSLNVQNMFKCLHMLLFAWNYRPAFVHP